MKFPIKVYLCGSEGNGWALDADLATTRQALLALPELVELTSLRRADVVYTVWEYPILHMDPKKLEGKKILCQICNDLMRIYEDPCMIRAAEMFGLWIPMTRECIADVEALGYRHRYIPYAVDTTVFTPCLPDDQTVDQLRRHYGIPQSSFVISNFMRDSSAQDLLMPKAQKGTELLLEIGRQLVEKKLPVHFLFAGPRRHWIKNRMKSLGIPFTFIGQESDRDDNDVNILPPDVVNLLYHISDLHLVTSRWEGGPRAVLESAATKTAILSTPVGVANDILQPQSLFTSVDEGVETIEAHVQRQILAPTIEEQYQVLVTSHTPKANVPRFRHLFEKVEEVPVFSVPARWQEVSALPPSFCGKVSRKMRSLLGIKPAVAKPLCISLWHEFHKPPYGGGNQFMMALHQAMKDLGVTVVTNKFSRSVDVHICNSAWFDKQLFEKKAHDYPVRMIHRIDGPTTLYRGEGREEDDRIFALNKQFATATVFQSAYSFKKSYELGYQAVAPVIIHNSVNPDTFNAQGRRSLSEGEKIRLISSSWSDNPRKGGPFLQWLDDHLDWNRFEYTFVGRVKETFQHINHIPPQDSTSLAEILRDHDIFLSVSHNEPCSNALLEALACGLPALYRDDGGNGELVSFGGLPFEGKHDVLVQLDRVAAQYDSFQRLIHVNNIEEIARKYIVLAGKLIDWDFVAPG